MRKRDSKRYIEVPRCCSYRHWFTPYGEVGNDSPTCGHCGVPNPYIDPSSLPLSDKDRAKYAAAVEALKFR